MKNLLQSGYALLMLMLIFSCQGDIPENLDWTLVYRNDAAGQTLFGDKEELIKAVRNGLPVRVGFGGRRSQDTIKSVEHVADAQFLTIANGQEVFAQITPIIGQRPHLDADTLRIELRAENKWTLVIGTNGERSTLSMFDDPQITEASGQSRRGSSWFVNYPIAYGKRENETKPFWDR